MIDLDAARAKIRSGLPKLGTRFGTGALPLDFDPALGALDAWAKIRQQLADGVPESASLTQYVHDAYDQGTEYSCVAFSTAGMQSVFVSRLDNTWLTFDAEECYYANGGTGAKGISSSSALAWDEHTGFRCVPDNRKRYQISSYAFVDSTSAAGQLTIKAAIATGNPCVIALLLPADFDAQMHGSGDCQSATTTSDYHQVCAVGYTPDRLTILNSWGANWGTRGLGSIRWSFISQSEQAHFGYAFTGSEKEQIGFRPFFAARTSSPD